MICEIVISHALGYPFKMTNPQDCDVALPEYPPIVCVIHDSGRRMNCADKCGNPVYWWLKQSDDTVRILWEAPEKCSQL